MSHPLLAGALPFLEALFQELERNAFSLPPHWDLDHLCYRVADPARYRELRDELAQTERLLAETPVAGRPIASFALTKPIEFRGARIDVLELPAPKAPVSEGFEHLEIVADRDFAEIQAPALPLEPARGPDGAPKTFNAELKLTLGARNLKLHHLSLASVIRLEENARVFDALRASKILEDFRAHGPLLAGTFPLGIATPDSDLDILLRAADLDALAGRLRENFGDAPGFTHRTMEVDGRPTLLVNFRFRDLPFEIFAQDLAPVRQRAYRHFLIEEKLLKYGGAALTESVRAARRRGLKTEPAFGEALKIAKDPYETLLEWQELPIPELRQRLAAL